MSSCCRIHFTNLQLFIFEKSILHNFSVYEIKFVKSWKNDIFCKICSSVHSWRANAQTCSRIFDHFQPFACFCSWRGSKVTCGLWQWFIYQFENYDFCYLWGDLLQKHHISRIFGNFRVIVLTNRKFRISFKLLVWFFDISK